MVETALRKRWNTPKELVEQAVVNALMSGDDRAAASAARVAIAMEAMNQRDEHKAIDVTLHIRRDEVAAIASEFGVEVSVIEDAERSARGGDSTDDGDDNGAYRDGA